MKPTRSADRSPTAIAFTAPPHKGDLMSGRYLPMVPSIGKKITTKAITATTTPIFKSMFVEDDLLTGSFIVGGEDSLKTSRGLSTAGAC